MLPDYRTGAIVLPCWIVTLALIWLGKKRHDARTK